MKEKKEKNKQKKSRIFGLLMALYAFIWLVVIVFMADYVWDKAYEYQCRYDKAKEQSYPEVFLNEFVKNIDERQLVLWLFEDGGYEVSSYGNLDEYEQYFRMIIGDRPLVYEKTDEKYIYDINTGRETVARIKIASDNMFDEFNFTGWRLVDADVVSYMGEAIDKTIVVDKNYKVYINDKELTVDYRTEEQVTVMGQHMSGITGEQYGIDIYRVEGFLVEPKIYVVDKYGNKVENTSSEADILKYVSKDEKQIDDIRQKRVEDTFLMYFEHINKLKKYEDIKPYLLKGTAAYELIEAAQKSLEWVVPVKKLSIEEKTISDYVEYGDSYFSCNIYMNVLKDYGYTTKNEYFDAAVLFKKEKNVWYLDTFILNQ